MRDYEERVVIVTGGSAGIGRAAALRFAERGAHVLVTGRREEPLRRMEAERPGLVGLSADAGAPEDARRVVEEALDRWDRIDVLVNNAGRFAARALEEVSADLVRGIFDVNVLGPTLLAQAALPHLERSGGAVVNVSSTFGHKAAPMIGHYAASKAALEMLTRSWALELAPRGVRVNAVAPGPTETEILAHSGMPPAAIEALKAEEARRIPLGRRGTAGEVAHWIVALADSMSAWVTGQVVAVDGGLSVT